MKLIYTPEQLNEAAGLLAKYYEIPAETLQTPGGKLELDSTVAKGVLEAYATVGDCSCNDLLQRVFLILTHVVLTSPEFTDQRPADQKHSKRLRLDLLRLYILNGTTRMGDALIIKNRSRSIRMENDANWFFREIIGPYLALHLEPHISLKQAEKELESGQIRHRGRSVNDPRVPRLMLGTWRLLTDLHGFRTPMPNVLCNFIISLLQLQGIFPENMDIDTLWVRAQLRYLNGKADKHNQESSSGS